MNIQNCPHCHIRVVPKGDNTCPNCNASFNNASTRHSTPLEVPNTFEDLCFHSDSVGPFATINPFQPPTDLDEAIKQPSLNDLVLVFFSFRGRVPRLTYWCASIAVPLIFVIAVTILTMVLGEGSESLPPIVLVLYLLAIWASLALTVKRWHDRDKSGWWTLIYFVPLIGPLWLSLELGFLPGTKGANRFGPAPSRHQHELQQSVV